MQKTGGDAAAANDPEQVSTLVAGDEVTAIVTAETAAVDDPDRWAWPHSTAMTDAEIDSFTARLARFTDKGLSLDDGEALADKLVQRDRESDDRQLCLECLHLTGQATGSWRCRDWQRAGIASQARDAGLPGDLVRTLQRCDGFTAAT